MTESVFAWPGMGKLLIDSINVLDRPVIVAYLLIIVSLFVFINLLVDLAYSALSTRACGLATRERIDGQCSAGRQFTMARKAGEFAADRMAMFGLVLFVLIVLAALGHHGCRRRTPTTCRSWTCLMRVCRRVARRRMAALSARQRRAGRDLLSAILYGLRISLGVGVVSTLIAVTLGLLVGCWPPARGALGQCDHARGRHPVVVPAILIALILLAVLGQGIGKIIAALVTVQWAYYARTVRGAALPRKTRITLPPHRGSACQLDALCCVIYCQTACRR